MTTNIKAEHGWLINAGNSQSLYKQAAASAMTLKINQQMPVAVCVDRADNWPDEYEDCVDYIVEYPFSDTSATMPYPQLNQWQLYHVTPFKNNVLIEADTLVLSNMDYVWHLGNTNVQLPKSVVDFAIFCNTGKRLNSDSVSCFTKV